MDLDAILHDRGSPVATPTVRCAKPKRGRYTRPRTESQRRLLPRSLGDVDKTQLGVGASGAQGSSGGSAPLDYGSVSGVTRTVGATGERSSISDRTRLIDVSSMPSLAQHHRRDTGSSSLALPRSGGRLERTPSSSAASGVAAPNGEDAKQNARSSGDAPATHPRTVGFSRRKAPIAPAVRYLTEVVCTDLMACGEYFVPDDGAGQTLIPFGSFVPIEVDEAVDAETARFMEGGYNEAYGRNVGLPGLAWASAKARLDEISTLSSDPSFESGGDRLFQAARLFHSALSIPLYSAKRLVLWGIGFWQLMGVVVVYFPGPENHASALIAYASAVAASASSVSELMVHRSLFVEGRANRVKRNFRVMRVAIMFAVPRFAKYYRLTGKTVVDGVLDADEMESGSVIVAPRTNLAVKATTFRTPRRRLSIKKSLRRPLQQTAIPPGASAVLASREATELKISITGGGLTDWLYQYFAKVRGGPAHMPEPARPRDAMLTWVGAFLGIGVADMVFNIINGSFAWRGQEDLFVLSGSFGALSTLLYALPAVPLAQPRVVFSAHGMAITVSMLAISVFERGRLVWLQKALTVSSATLGMSLMGIVHPPAGALCLVFIGAYNKGSTEERIEMLIVSVMLGLLIHVSIAILVNNLSPRRAYPVFW